MTKKLLQASGLAGLLLFTAACGETNWVKDAKINAYTQNGEVYGELTSYLETGNLSLPSMELPIYLPRYGTQQMGYLRTRPSLGKGDTELTVAINLSQTGRLPRGMDKPELPNGSPLPIAGYDPGSVLMFEIPGKGSRVYAAIDLDEKQAMMGVAIPIRQFDSFGRNIPGANLFPPFSLNNGVLGVFGIFTGVQSGQSGMALFADVSELLATKQLQQLANSEPGVFQSLAKADRGKGRHEIRYSGVSPSAKDEQAIQWGLYKLNRKKTLLTID